MTCPLLNLPEGCPLKLAKCPINEPPEFGSFTDLRDGRTYKTVKICEQVWLAENLAFAYAGSKVYNNDLANEAKYGRLYDWETAKKAVLPGWHLPSDEEWQTLVDFAGGKDIAGKKLKAKSGWHDDGGETDKYGFSALPGGFGSSDGYFYDVGNYGGWWSSTEDGSDDAYYRRMSYDGSGVLRGSHGNKSNLLSVRCVRDYARSAAASEAGGEQSLTALAMGA